MPKAPNIAGASSRTVRALSKQVGDVSLRRLSSKIQSIAAPVTADETLTAMSSLYATNVRDFFPLFPAVKEPNP